jgi:hypothetical protein
LQKEIMASFSRSRTMLIRVQRERVFSYMDDIAHTGMHMTGRSMMMMGSKLILAQLSGEATGPNARYRWHGRMMGLPMDFTVAVTKWAEGRENCWETIGEARMIILSWYRMELHLADDVSGTRATLSIAYELPHTWFWRMLARMLAPWYAQWCLKSMLNDSRRALEAAMPIPAVP